MSQFFCTAIEDRAVCIGFREFEDLPETCALMSLLFQFTLCLSVYEQSARILVYRNDDEKWRQCKSLSALATYDIRMYWFSRRVGTWSSYVPPAESAMDTFLALGKSALIVHFFSLLQKKTFQFPPFTAMTLLPKKKKKHYWQMKKRRSHSQL